jgi:hypothetical protein
LKLFAFIEAENLTSFHGQRRGGCVVVVVADPEGSALSGTFAGVHVGRAKAKVVDTAAALLFATSKLASFGISVGLSRGIECSVSRHREGCYGIER